MNRFDRADHLLARSAPQAWRSFGCARPVFPRAGISPTTIGFAGAAPGRLDCLQILHPPWWRGIASSTDAELKSRTGLPSISFFPVRRSFHVHFCSEQQRLGGEQVALHKRQLARLSDQELRLSYEMYLRALQLDKGNPPVAAKVQYFVECWRELRRRRRHKRARPRPNQPSLISVSRSTSLVSGKAIPGQLRNRPRRARRG